MFEQEFIHEADEHTKRIIEKRFHPISYNPVKRSYIENLQIQVVNELFEPVFIKDSKTVVIIHFRKRKWKYKSRMNKTFAIEKRVRENIQWEWEGGTIGQGKC